MRSFLPCPSSRHTYVHSRFYVVIRTHIAPSILTPSPRMYVCIVEVAPGRGEQRREQDSGKIGLTTCNHHHPAIILPTKPPSLSIHIKSPLQIRRTNRLLSKLHVPSHVTYIHVLNNPPQQRHPLLHHRPQPRNRPTTPLHLRRPTRHLPLHRTMGNRTTTTNPRSNNPASNPGTPTLPPNMHRLWRAVDASAHSSHGSNAHGAECRGNAAAP